MKVMISMQDKNYVVPAEALEQYAVSTDKFNEALTHHGSEPSTILALGIPARTLINHPEVEGQQAVDTTTSAAGQVINTWKDKFRQWADG